MKRIPGLRSVRGEVEFMSNSLFETEFFEAYWGPVIVGQRPYEPEIMLALERFGALHPTFVDGGANYGFWSIVVTSPQMRYPHAVAIEPNPPTFARLERNCALNDHRFEIIERAISDVGDKTVTLSAADTHVIAHIAIDGDGPRVSTTTIDAVIDSLDWWSKGPFVVKIDLEGHEIEGIRGARRMIDSTAHVWIFEDFEESGLKTLQHFLSLGYRIHYIDSWGSARPIDSLPRAKSELRRDSRAGRSRNFFAARDGSPFHDVLVRW